MKWFLWLSLIGCIIRILGCLYHLAEGKFPVTVTRKPDEMAVGVVIGTAMVFWIAWLLYHLP